MTEALLFGSLNGVAVPLEAIPNGDGTYSLFAGETQQAFLDFGENGNLAAALNSEVLVDNAGGFASIAFYLAPPVDSAVAFEGSFDGSHWDGATLRSTGGDGYLQSTSSTDNFTGSIAAMRRFRVRVSSAGSGAAGTVMGRIVKGVSTLEGIEHQAPPHKYGFEPVHKAKEFTTTQTGAAIWTPTAGRKFVLTDLSLSVSTTGTVTIFDNTNAEANIIFKADYETPGNGGSFRDNITYRTPIVGGAVDNVLKITTSGNMTVRVQANGYETP